MTRTNRMQAALAVCVFVFIGLCFAFIRPGLQDYAPYLSFSPDRDGTKALRTLLAQEGADVREWRLTPDRLPKEEGQLYLAIDPRSMTQTAGDELEAWASEYGNDIVILESVPGPLSYWGSEEPRLTDEEIEEVSSVVAVRETRETTHDASVESWFRLTEVESGEVVLKDEYGVVAARKVIGEGSITLALVPAWTQNSNILEGEQFELLWSLLGGTVENRTVYVDEYHHGYAISPGISQVYPLWLLAGFGQTAIAIAIWLWWKGKRIGPAFTPREFRVRRSDETLLAVAGWYRRGKLRRESLGYRVDHLKRMLLSRSAGLPADAKAGDILAASKTLLKQGTLDKLKGVLLRWEQSGAGYSEKQWLTDSAVIDDAVRTIEGER